MVKGYKSDYSEVISVLLEKKALLEKELEYLEKLLDKVKERLDEEGNDENTYLLKEYRDLVKEKRNTVDTLSKIEKQIQKYKDLTAESVSFNVDNVLGDKKREQS